MCEYEFKKGKNAGTKCPKKPRVNSQYCTTHSKYDASESSSETNSIPEVIPSAPVNIINPDVVTIRFSKKLIEGIDHDELSEIYMSTLVEILNTIKIQHSLMTTKLFSVPES